MAEIKQNKLENIIYDILENKFKRIMVLSYTFRDSKSKNVTRQR